MIMYPSEMFFRFASDTSKSLPDSEKTPDTSDVHSETSAVEVPSDSDTSHVEVPSDSGTKTDSETQTPTEYSYPTRIPIHLTSTSCGIMNVYLQGIATGVFIGGGVGSLVGALAGFVVSTLSVPLLLIGDVVFDVIETCRKRKTM